MKAIIHPSILNSNFLELGNTIKMLNESECDMIHLDVMDGNYVPNLSFGLPVIEQIKKVSEKPLDVHLMISNAESYIERYRDAGADNLTIHFEAVSHLHLAIMKIRELGMTASVSLNPATPVHLLSQILSELHMVLIMTVNPGFGGQSFIPQMFNKIRRLNQIIVKKDLSIKISVDGGINKNNIKDVVAAGTDIVVAGSAIFKQPQPAQVLQEFKEACE